MPDPSEIPENNGLGDISQLMTILNQLFGGGSSTEGNENSPEAMATAQMFLPLLTSMFTSGDFSPEAAVRDSQGEVQLMMKQLIEGGMPGIQGAEGVSGGYNSTTAQLLRNDLATRAAGQGAARVSQVKNQYAGTKNAQAMMMIQLINAMSNANRNRTNNTTTKGVADNANARRAAAAAAALAALKPSKGPAGTQSGKNPQKPIKPANLPGQQGGSSNRDDLNDQAARMGYGAGDKDDPNEILSNNGIGSESSDDLAERSGVDQGSIADRVDESSDPNYDPYDMMGDLGSLNPGGEFDFTALDPFDPMDLSGFDLGGGNDNNDDGGGDVYYELGPEDYEGGDGSGGGDGGSGGDWGDPGDYED